MILLFYTFIVIMAVLLVNRGTFWLGIKSDIARLIKEISVLLEKRYGFLNEIIETDNSIPFSDLSDLSLGEIEYIINEKSLRAIDYFKTLEAGISNSEQLALIDTFKSLETAYVSLRQELSSLLSVVQSSFVLKRWPLFHFKYWLLGDVKGEELMNDE